MKAARQLRRGKADIVILLALALGACAPLAAVKEIKPRLTSQYGTAVERAIAQGQNLEHNAPTRAIGYYLSGVEISNANLRKDPSNTVALGDYDFALSRVFSVLRNAHLHPWAQPLRIPIPSGGEYILTYRPLVNPLWKPQEFELIPADELQLHGQFVVPRVTRAGIGAPLVAIRTPDAPTIRQPFIPPRIYAAVTAIAHVSGRTFKIEFVDPLATETVSVSGRSVACAADFTAPVAMGLAREHPEKVGLSAMLNPEKFADQTRLVRIQPYDPKKIPVLFVHGLQSTPVAWAGMLNALCADPVVRQNYQAWVFGYPSGYPVPYSAMLLRRQLDALDKAFPNHRPIILVGHSMGGILSGLMITDSDGDKVWRYFFGKPPSQTALSAAAKALLKEALIFKPRHHIARVIFISTPHRGSVIAQGGIGRLTSSMIHRSTAFAGVATEALQASVVQQEDPGVLKLRRMPDSIDTLSPNDAWVKVMNLLPMEKDVPYHSIIGDRGRGDTPNSSDGVVPYWSSHLDGAASEKIVPSNHNANQSPEGIAEVVRILRQHIGNRDQSREAVGVSSRGAFAGTEAQIGPTFHTVVSRSAHKRP